MLNENTEQRADSYAPFSIDKGKFMFLAIGKRDEFNPFSKWIEPRLSRLERMKNIFMYTPEWVRNGDKGIASIVAGVEMGQHCLMNPVQANLMFDDGTPMEPKLPRGVTGWLADRREERRTKGAL